MADQKKPFQVHIKYEDSKTTKAVKKAGKAAGKVAKGVGSVIATVLLICVITGTLVAGIAALLVMQKVNTDATLDLSTVDLCYTTIIYGQDDNGDPVEVQRIYANGENRVWVDLEQIPEDLQYAFICTEDKRFKSHVGVDFKRVMASFINEIVQIFPNRQGASTITMQLVKNVTGDKDVSISRKVTEIFRAINLEKYESKDDILEAYLNTIAFANGINGVQSAATAYFNKDVSDLTLAECASIAAITQNPTYYNPYTNPENNKERQELMLYNMYDQGVITEEEYEAAVAEKLTFHKEVLDQQIYSIWNYYVDQVVNDVIADLVAEKGYTREDAESRVFSGGLRIYTPMNPKIQEQCEKIFANKNNFPLIKNPKGETQQGAAVVMDLKGNVLGMAGAIGEKTGSRVLNRAAQSKRQIGSTMKPLGAYAPGIEYDLITFSSMFHDSANTEAVPGGNWPSNWYGYHTKKMLTVDYALQNSVNTVATKVCSKVTAKRSFDFVTTKFGLDLVKYRSQNGQVYSDMNIAPMSLGALTDGVTPMDLTAAYAAFGNGGTYYSPITYSKVCDFTEEVIYEKKSISAKAMSSDTATVMNKLLQNVVFGPYGSGKESIFGKWELAGKTGTTESGTDFWYTGCSPYYACTIWFGYDTPYPSPNLQPCIRLWRQVMQPLHNGLPNKKFPVDATVKKLYYCSATGLIAGEKCKSKQVGWYKQSNIPETCEKCATASATTKKTTKKTTATTKSTKPNGQTTTTLPGTTASSATGNHQNTPSSTTRTTASTKKE